MSRKTHGADESGLPVIGGGNDLGIRVVGGAGRKKKRITLREGIDLFVGMLELAGSKPDCLTMYRSTLNMFARFVGGKADGPMDEIQTEDVIAYLKSLRAAGRRKATVHRHFGNIRTLFNKAIDAGRLEWSPVACLRMRKPVAKRRAWLETPDPRRTGLRGHLGC